MPTHKSCDYKLLAVKYYLSHSKNQVQTCKIFGCSERSLILKVIDDIVNGVILIYVLRHYP